MDIDLKNLGTASGHNTLRKVIAENDLYQFLIQAWPIIEPGVDYLDNWHIEYITEWLELVSLGEVTRLVINIPTRYMKSTIGTIMWPCWEWARTPWQQYLTTSYSEFLSKYHSNERRKILRSQWYMQNWPMARIRPDVDQATFFENVSGGHMIASSVLGTATGLGGNRVIIDDPMNPKQAVSDAERTRINETARSTLMGRLNDKKRGAMVMFMQRLHIDDSTAYLTGVDDADLVEGKVVIKAGDWIILRLPAVAEADTHVVFPRSGTVVDWREGSPLWESREGLTELRQRRLEFGEEDYAAQYLQRAQPKGGAIFKHSWFRNIFYQPIRKVPVEVLIHSWDTSFKDKDASSFVVGQVWGRYRLENYLLQEVRGRWDFPTALTQMKMLRVQWPKTTRILIEDTANGPAIISTMKTEVAGVTPVTPEGSKVARAKAITSVYETGHVWYPDPLSPGNEWVADHVQELTRFTGASSKVLFTDRVDAASQALSYLEATYGARALVDRKSARPVKAARSR